MLHGTVGQHIFTIIIIYIFIKNFIFKYSKILHKKHTLSAADLLSMRARQGKEGKLCEQEASAILILWGVNVVFNVYVGEMGLCSLTI